MTASKPFPITTTTSSASLFDSSSSHPTPIPPMPSNINTTTVKPIGPFKPTANASNTIKTAQLVVKQPALKVDISRTSEAPVDSERASANQSDEENVRPSKHVQESSESLSPLPTTVLGIPKAQERDMRAYEHERQRTKRAGERVLNRARKAGAVGQGGTGKRAISGSQEDRDAKRKQLNKPKVEIDDGVVAIDKAASPVRAAMLIEGLSMAGPGAGLGVIAKANERAISSLTGGKSVQVDFSELLMVSQRKPRKAKDEEFELVPAVRAVIVLDDMPTQLVHDMVIDEPWEHIESEESVETEGKKAAKVGEPSYAQVVIRASE